MSARGEPAMRGRRRRRGPVCGRDHGDAGQVALWLLGLCVMLLFVGGISLDLWRAMGERRALAGVADTAAVAGAAGIDVEAYRSTGLVVLDPDLAVARALDSVAVQNPPALRLAPIVDLAADGAVVVELHGEVDLTLMRVLLPSAPALPITVRSAAAPRDG